MLSTILNKHSVIGVIGNRGTAKTSLTLTLLKELKQHYPNVNIKVMGVEEELEDVLKALNIGFIHSKMDLLDLNLKDTIFYVDEFALFFDTQAKSKEQNKLMRFFDRLEHQNCKIIISTAREGYYNKFMCSRVEAFLVKQIEYDSLVNGTWIKERVKAINSNSDYRLETALRTYYIVTKGDDVTYRHNFPYVAEFDTKRFNKNLFKKDERKDEKEDGKKNETLLPDFFISRRERE